MYVALILWWWAVAVSEALRAEVPEEEARGSELLLGEDDTGQCTAGCSKNGAVIRRVDADQWRPWKHEHLGNLQKIRAVGQKERATRIKLEDSLLRSPSEIVEKHPQVILLTSYFSDLLSISSTTGNTLLIAPIPASAMLVGRLDDEHVNAVDAWRKAGIPASFYAASTMRNVNYALTQASYGVDESAESYLTETIHTYLKEWRGRPGGKIILEDHCTTMDDWFSKNIDVIREVKEEGHSLAVLTCYGARKGTEYATMHPEIEGFVYWIPIHTIVRVQPYGLSGGYELLSEGMDGVETFLGFAPQWQDTPSPTPSPTWEPTPPPTPWPTWEPTPHPTPWRPFAHGFADYISDVIAATVP